MKIDRYTEETMVSIRSIFLNGYSTDINNRIYLLIYFLRLKVYLELPVFYLKVLRKLEGGELIKDIKIGCSNTLPPITEDLHKELRKILDAEGSRVGTIDCADGIKIAENIVTLCSIHLLDTKYSQEGDWDNINKMSFILGTLKITIMEEMCQLLKTDTAIPKEELIKHLDNVAINMQHMEISQVCHNLNLS